MKFGYSIIKTVNLQFDKTWIIQEDMDELLDDLNSVASSYKLTGEAEHWYQKIFW